MGVFFFKKSSVSDSIFLFLNTVATGCYVVSIIDLSELFGIFGHPQRFL